MAAIETPHTSQQQQFSLPKMSTNGAVVVEVESAKCECCGLTEECTDAYIKRVRERFQGRWICGLCSEAVKEEVVRSDTRIGKEEALNLHMSFCKKFRYSRPPPNPTEELISAIKHLLLRSLDSPRKQPLVRSESCFTPLER